MKITSSRVKQIVKDHLNDLYQREKEEPLKYGKRMLIGCKFDEKLYEEIRNKRMQDFLLKDDHCYSSQDSLPKANYGNDGFVYMFFRIQKNKLLKFEYTKQFLEKNNESKIIMICNYSPWVVSDLVHSISDYINQVPDILQYISNYCEPDTKELFTLFTGLTLPSIKLPEKYDFTKEGKIIDRRK